MGSDLAQGTLVGRLAHIEQLYVAAHRCFGEDCLDRVIADADFDRLETALESCFVAARNQAAAADRDRSADWSSVMAFVRDIMRARMGTEAALGKAEARLTHLDRLYRQVRPSASLRKRPLVRALPADVVAELYDLCDPMSSKNPFRTEAGRWRNYALFLLYLHQGLRRSEALLLPANAMQDGIDGRTGEMKYWINVDGPESDDDARYIVPSLKTTLSRRQLPVSPEIVTVVEHYTDNFRGRQDSPYLFVSNQGRPLAVNSVNLVIETLYKALSDMARRSLSAHMRGASLSPHDFRHTCAVVRLSEFIESGMEMDIALQNLRAFFGWSPSSEMPRHYSRAYFEDALMTVWRRKFDDRADVLRQLNRLGRHGEVLESPRDPKLADASGAL